MRSGLGRFVVPFLFLQAILVAAWWILLWTWPAARAPFVIADWPLATLCAFALPDIALIVIGSAAAAWGLARQRPWARAVLWVLGGAVGYATLWCFGALACTGSGWLCVALMAASCAGTLWALHASAP